MSRNTVAAFGMLLIQALMVALQVPNVALAMPVCVGFVFLFHILPDRPL